MSVSSCGGGPGLYCTQGSLYSEVYGIQNHITNCRRLLIPCVMMVFSCRMWFDKFLHPNLAHSIESDDDDRLSSFGV